MAGLDRVQQATGAGVGYRHYLLLPATIISATLGGFLVAVVGIGPTVIAITAVATLFVVPLFFALRQDEAIALVIIATSLFIDWYQLVDAAVLLRLPIHVSVVSTLLAFLLVGTMYFSRSSARPWHRVPYVPLWILLLILALYPLLESQLATGAIKYYITVFVAALLMYVIGVQIGGDIARTRRLLALLGGLGAAIALHTVIYARTGVFLLATSTLDSYLQTKGDFVLTGSTSSRAGSFLFNPDINGAFLALILFIPITLWVTSKSGWGKLIYLVEIALILLALFFTYSTAAWLAVAVGFLMFVVFVIRGGQRYLLLGAIIAVCATIVVALPTELESFTRHSTDPSELTLREGGWLTATRVISAHPLGGLGLNFDTYEQLSAPYRVVQEYVPLGHPHEAYLELAALGGIPVLVVFLALIGLSLRMALRNFRSMTGSHRALLGGAAVAIVVLSVNSLAINGWTLGPLVVIAWLILGIVSSPVRAEVSESIGSFESQPSPMEQDALRGSLVT